MKVTLELPEPSKRMAVLVTLLGCAGIALAASYQSVSDGQQTFLNDKTFGQAGGVGGSITINQSTTTQNPALLVNGDAGVGGTFSAGYITGGAPVFFANSTTTNNGGTVSFGIRILTDGTTGRAFKVTGAQAESASGTAGTGTVIVRATDGTNTCDATFLCASDLNSAGVTVSKVSSPSAGTCTFAAGATVACQTIDTCGTTHMAAGFATCTGYWQ